MNVTSVIRFVWLVVKFIKHNQHYYLKLDVSTSIRGLHQKKLVLSPSSHRPRNSREPYHQLVSSDGDRQRARAFLPDGLKRPYASERKDNRTTVMRQLPTELRIYTTAFLTRRLPVVSRTGRTEYQLLLMKASDRGRNVKF